MLTDNPIVSFVFVVLGGIVGVWGFFRCPAPTLLVNYSTLIMSNAAKFIPALAVFVGTQTTIQQELCRKPDEHMASEAYSPEALQEASNTMEEVGLSAMQVPVFASDTVSMRLRDKGWVQFASQSEQTPLPLIVSSSITNSSSKEGESSLTNTASSNS